MKRKSFIIEGINLKSLPELVQSQLIKRADDFVFNSTEEEMFIFYFEEFSQKTNSTRLSSLILEFKNEKFVLIELVTGGGSVGYAERDKGSESLSIHQIEAWLKELCNQQKWHLKTL